MKRPLESFAQLKGKDLERELRQLRGAQSFSKYPKWMAGSQKAAEPAEAGGDNTKKILLVLVAAAAFAYVMYGM
jgi:hypothetical protein